MRPGPDPLQRLAVLRELSQVTVIDPPVDGLGGPGLGDRPGAVGVTEPLRASDRDGPAPLAPGRHRPRPDDASAHSGIGETFYPHSDLETPSGFPMLGGWVPTDAHTDAAADDAAADDAAADDAAADDASADDAAADGAAADYAAASDTDADAASASSASASASGSADADADADADAAADGELVAEGAIGVQPPTMDDRVPAGGGFRVGRIDGSAGNGDRGAVEADLGDLGELDDLDELEDLDELDELDESDQPTRAEVRAKRLGNRPWGRLAELWVPESLRDARIDPGRRGMLVLVLVAALAAVATAIGVWRDRPEPRPVETVALAPASDVAAAGAAQRAPNPSGPPGSTEDQPPSTGPTASSMPPPTEIVVSVTGLVAHPGVVTLAAGARVADAIAAAGGSTAEADLTGLNLAAKLADGDSVVIGAAATGGASSGVSNAAAGAVGAPGRSGAAAGQPATAPLVDLNTADEAALDSLPGVGPVMAQNILAWREQNGRFSSIEQLQEISGIGPARYAQISALVTVS